MIDYWMDRALTAQEDADIAADKVRLAESTALALDMLRRNLMELPVDPVIE